MNLLPCSGLVGLLLLGAFANARPLRTVKRSDETREAIMAAYSKGDLVPFTLELMRSAKSSEELLARDQQIKKLMMVQTICQDELLGKRNPYHCYRLIQIEKTIGFLKPKTASQTSQFLDELCIVQIHEIPFLDSEEQAALSKACHQAFVLSEQRARYVQIETQPSVRFAQRFERSKNESDGTRVTLADSRHRFIPKPARDITNTLK